MTDGAVWLASDDGAGGGTVWTRAGTLEPTVTISSTAGDNPGTTPPAGVPRVGDFYINETDDAVWIRAHDPAGSTNDIWQPLSAAAGRVYVTDTTGDVPENPTAGQTQYAFPAGYTAAEGDRLVNRTDRISWVYGPDPSVPGAFIWIEIPTQNTAYLSTTPGEVPENPGAGQTPHTFVRPPRVGDVFVNRADQVGWVRVTDTASGTDIWEPLPVPRQQVVTSTDVAGEDPATYTPALTPEPGDVFVNVTDELSWIAIDDPANTGTTVWEPLRTVATVVTSTDVAGEDPGTYTFVAPPNPGDIFVNRTDDRAWIAVDDPSNQGTTVWQRTAIPGPQFTVSQTAGETPTAPGTTTMPTQTDPGDIFINHADGFAWIAVPDVAGTAVEWQLVGAPPEQITVSQTADETPTQPGTTVMPTTSRPGDVFINVPDRGTWTAFDNAGTLDWQRASVEGPEFTVSQTAGETPSLPGTTAMPTTTEFGDIFINHADDFAWVAVPDAAGQVDWQLIGQPPVTVTVEDSAPLNQPANPASVTSTSTRRSVCRRSSDRTRRTPASSSGRH